jgi:hypothetical protein
MIARSPERPSRTKRTSSHAAYSVRTVRSQVSGQKGAETAAILQEAGIFVREPRLLARAEFPVTLISIFEK